MPDNSRVIRAWVPCLSRLAVLLTCAQAAAAQTASGLAWSSWGVLPFSAVDIRVIDLPAGYVMYFTSHADGQPVPRRAYSPDLRTWTLDDRDFCASSGLCTSAADGVSALGHRPIVRLLDGRYRLFRKFGDTLVSFVSSDAQTWTREAGMRFMRDASRVWERGPRTLTGLDFIRLADGRLRLYYSGVVVPGTEGTRAEYANCGGCMGILSAVSSDDGLTFTREPGVRVDPREGAARAGRCDA